MKNIIYKLKKMYRHKNKDNIYPVKNGYILDYMRTNKDRVNAIIKEVK